MRRPDGLGECAAPSVKHDGHLVFAERRDGRGEELAAADHLARPVVRVETELEGVERLGARERHRRAFLRIEADGDRRLPRQLGLELRRPAPPELRPHMVAVAPLVHTFCTPAPGTLKNTPNCGGCAAADDEILTVTTSRPLSWDALTSNFQSPGLLHVTSAVPAFAVLTVAITRPLWSMSVANAPATPKTAMNAMILVTINLPPVALWHG